MLNVDIGTICLYLHTYNEFYCSLGDSKYNSDSKNVKMLCKKKIEIKTEFNHLQFNFLPTTLFKVFQAHLVISFIQLQYVFHKVVHLASSNSPVYQTGVCLFF